MQQTRISFAASSDMAAKAIALRGLLALGVAMGIGRFAFTPLFPLMQVEWHLSWHAGGWLAGVNYLGYLAGAMLAGRQGMSAARLMQFGLALVVVGTGLMGVAASIMPWLLLRFVAGVASAWVLVGAATLILTQLVQTSRSRWDGVVFSGVGVGIAITGLICWGGGMAGLTASALWLLLAVLALVGSWLVCKRGGVAMPGGTSSAGETSCPNVEEEAEAHIGNQRNDGFRQLALCYGLFGLGYILPATYLPAQAREMLESPMLFGMVWPVFGSAAALSTLVITKLTRWSARSLWAFAQIVMAIGMLLPFVHPDIYTLSVAALCVGGTFMVITLLGLQQARAGSGSEIKRRLSLMTAAFAIGQLSGPLMVNGLLAMGLGVNASLWLGIIALLISSMLLLSREE